MDYSLMKKIADLMESIQKMAGWERATIAGRDCLLQWDASYCEDQSITRAHVNEVIQAWENWLNNPFDVVNEERHGVCVPVIPM